MNNSESSGGESQPVSLSCPFANGYKIDFSHHCSVNEVEVPINSATIVRNVVCRRVGNSFKKLTEINVGGKLIVLEDTYEFVREVEDGCSGLSTYASPTEVDSKEPKHSEEDDEFGQRSSGCKNVVKNIVKSFAKCIKERSIGNAEQVEANKTLQHLLRRNKFNNKLIVKLVGNPVLSNLFRSFLDSEVLEWLSRSKLTEKEATMATIQTYRRLLEG